jgi:S1-C subfamily serine protease
LKLSASSRRSLGALLAPLLGCIHPPTYAEKEASFRTFAERHGDSAGLRELLSGRVVQVFEFAEGRSWRGSATAITADGYFLTASHCLKALPVAFLSVQGRMGPELVAARVVWDGRGGLEKPEADLAILKPWLLPIPVAYFEWASTDELEADRQVVVAGYSRDAESPSWSFDARLQLAAGRLIEIVEPAGGPASRLLHDAPLMDGDSGGPITTSSGRLVGINTAGAVGGIGRRTAFSLRPNRVWLEEILEQDRKDYSWLEPPAKAAQGARLP